MTTDLCAEAVILGLCIIAAANFIDITVTVNVTDKPIINSSESINNFKNNKQMNEG